MRRKTTRLLVILTALAVAMTFSVMPVSAAAKAPAKVKGVKVTKATNTYIELSWKKAARAKKYQVYYKVSSAKKWKSLKTKAKKVTIKKLKASTTYKFKVRALNGKKKGKFSKVVKQKTYATPGKIDVKTIFASKRTKNTIQLTWKGVSNVSWYEIAVYSMAGEELGRHQPKNTTCEMGVGAKPNTWFGFKIRAVNTKTGKNAAVIGPWSKTFYACTLSGDREIVGTKGSDGMIAYKMTGTRPFVIGEDEGLIPDGYFVDSDEYGFYFYSDTLSVDAVEFPSDFEPRDSPAYYDLSNVLGKTFKVGDTYNDETIKLIIFSPDCDSGQEYMTGYNRLTIVTDVENVYTW